jgi:hypothetical protein
MDPRTRRMVTQLVLGLSLILVLFAAWRQTR